ncbi:Glyoxalase/Bleomycin resistance protein/Dihydroxybiphenyl dioxygenase [Leptodontidium sp. MPI-SDFR-AT-0119]|nr:Glyoxalase/Bleomycin resistance protein/Dihydroxybiphenyl dioxygenase [Leptodontidium sp. MPI-SDFR-AT-0119]
MSTTPIVTIKALDHLVLTCKSIPRTTQWYTQYLGMKSQTFTSPSTPSISRHALLYGQQKINLHQQGAEIEPKAKTALPGTADLCFLVGRETSLEEAVEGFRREGIEVLEGGGVVERTGARGRIRSVYVRDPDGNLIELSEYEKRESGVRDI